jgi:hypothetical protein
MRQGIEDHDLAEAVQQLRPEVLPLLQTQANHMKSSTTLQIKETSRNDAAIVVPKGILNWFLSPA